MLVVNRSDHVAQAFNQVNPRNCTQCIIGKQHGAGVD